MDDYIELERRVLATVRQFFDQIADTPDDDCTLNPAVVGPVLRDFLHSPETLPYGTVLRVILQRRVSSFNLKAMVKLFLGTQRRALLRQDFFSSGDTYGGRRPDGTNGTDVRERINSFKLVLTSEITLGDINSTVGDLFSRLEIPVNVNLEPPWPRSILRNMNIQQWNDQNEARRSSFVRDSECNRIATVLEQAYGGTVDIVDQLRTTRHSGVINSIVDIAICRDGDPKVLIEIKRGSIFPLWQELQGSSIVSRAVPREHQGSSLLGLSPRYQKIRTMRCRS